VGACLSTFSCFCLDCHDNFEMEIPHVPWVLVLLVLFLGMALALPVWMRHVQQVSKGRSSGFQVGVFFCFEFFLGVSVFLAFFSSWFTFQLVLNWFLPWLGLDVRLSFWDDPMTPRGLLGFGMLSLLPYAVFTRLGLLVVRDCHQLCKQQRDLVAKYYNLGSIWKVF